MATLRVPSLQSQGVQRLSFLRVSPRKCTPSCSQRSCQVWPPGNVKALAMRLSWERAGPMKRQQHQVCLQLGGAGRKPLVVRATAVNGGEEDSTSTDQERAKMTSEEMDRRSFEVRRKVMDFFQKKSGYSWLLGPAAITATVVLPPLSINLVSLYQKSFFAGFIATIGIDVLFVLAADLFLVLTDKLGHHKNIDGGSPPWIGPWELTGYPEGYPELLNYVSYASVAVGVLATILAFLVGKLPAALAVFGPYLGVLFTQVAYERLVASDRLPVFPLVPIIYTVYRFRQLSRGRALLPFIANGSRILAGSINLSCTLWALYLCMYLTQLPWLYSTWNTNRMV